MLTYVISTSENKVLKSEILFDLVGYNKIEWMRSGLSAVADCTDEIIRRQQPMTAEEYRVVVLVDFLAFEKTLFPEENPVSEYLTIYRKLIEIYLYNHLYMPLRRAKLGFEGLEVFYIQYTEKNTIRENAAEKMHLAQLLELSEEEIERAAGKVDEEKKDAEESAPKSARAKAKKQEEEEPTETKTPAQVYDVFKVAYRDGEFFFRAEDFCKNTKAGESVTFDTFYRNFGENHVNAYRAFGARSRTYVAEAASARLESRAAFDNLNLSLALIRAYEQDMKFEDATESDDVLDIPKMNKEAFFRVIQKAYGKVKNALELVRQSGKANGFYRLETPTSVSADICRDTLTDEERTEISSQAKGKDIKDQFAEIRRYAATKAGEKSDDERKKLTQYMSAYKTERDKIRNHTTEQDVKMMLRDAKKQDKYPSGLEYENAVEKKKSTMRTILKHAINADYKGTDYEEEMKDANEVYDGYLRAKAMLAKNFRTHVVCLLLVLVAMIVPYVVLQSTDFSRVGAILLASIAVAIFSGVYIFSAFVHIIPLMRQITAAKIRMTDIYAKCLCKRAEAMLALRHRYELYLPAVEQIYYELYTLEVLHNANREINRHIEEHREMLECLRDVLLGMLNSMQVTHRATEDVALDEDEFLIGESIRANSIYKVFTLDVIEEIFGEGGMRI